MQSFLSGLALIAASALMLRYAIPRKAAGRTVTGSKWGDDLLPLTIVSASTIGIALLLSAASA